MSFAALSLYRAELQQRDILSAEAERDLVTRWRAGDQDAGTKLIEGCLPFVMTIALEYRRWGVPLEDIIQEGNIGLLKAADRFDPERKCRLATYAAYWIRAEIREYVVRGYRIVRLGSSKNERRALRAFRKLQDRDAESLAAASGLSVERATALLPVLSARDVSLDQPIGDGFAPIDRLASSSPSPEEILDTEDQRSRMSRALAIAVSELSPREQRIVQMRWLTEDPVTLEQLGRDFGVSKERVRQIEERAKRRMRDRVQEITREPASLCA